VTFFAINRHASETMEADLSLEGFGSAKSVEHTLIKHDDLEARNTAAKPDTVKPVKGTGAKISGKGLTLALPPHSYSMIRVSL
jgi:alpha-N-arabinofuranosidase